MQRDGELMKMNREREWTWSRAVWEIDTYLQRPDKRYRLHRPMEIARELGLTRLEAELALRYLLDGKRVGYRKDDGRYYAIYEVPKS
jgi:hypothetical protein